MKGILLLLILLPFLAGAQRKDTVLKFLDAQLEFTTEQNAMYYGVAVKREEGWFLLALYPDTTPLLKVHYKDRALKIKNGPYSSFYPKNKPAFKGFYTNNMKTGTWQSWYENGFSKDSGAYTRNIRTGTWKRWHNNGHLAETGNYLTTFTEEDMQVLRLTGMVPESGAKEGLFISWYRNGNKESEGRYMNNSPDGVWEWFHENGKRSTVETYHSGQLAELKCFDTLGIETGNLCSIVKPPFLKDHGDYRAYVMDNLTWPPEALKNRIEGDVKVRFRINKSGQLENLNVVAFSNVLKNAVEAFFKELPAWYPAISHNRVIDSEQEMLIPFRIYRED